MDVNTALQPKTLLRLEFPALAAYFQNLIKEQSAVDRVKELDARLLELTHEEVLPPAVYGVWLPIALDVVPELLQAAIRDPVSHGIRKAGIKADLLATPSVREVILVLKSIAKCQNVSDPLILSACAEDLIRLLQEDKSSRASPFLLRPLYPLCSSLFLKEALSTLPEGSLQAWLVQNLVKSHPDIVRQVALGRIAVPTQLQLGVLKDHAQELITSSEPYNAIVHTDLPPDLPPGIVFCLDLLYVMCTCSLLALMMGPARDEYVKKVLQLACRKKVPFDHITRVLK
ncbi:hypothetical protein ETB97_005366 [Aspergillus alliaceus]|uniref:Uncharacterized protein n=1 Tax=Petromyces alliaceus TaxID=209559 RepID=A0A8H6EBW0_PETAA|nr:hypothetical protein ETB97_005366 [Aspergillus burnettii]